MIRYKHLGLILDSGINRNMKKIFLLFSLTLAINAFTDNIIYEAGNVLESKKRTTPAVLYHYKNDLVRLLDSRVFGQYGRSSGNSRDIYPIRKGDKIRLLESLRNGEMFKVQLLEGRRQGSFYYFIETKTLKHFVLIESNSSNTK